MASLGSMVSWSSVARSTLFAFIVSAMVAPQIACCAMSHGDNSAPAAAPVQVNNAERAEAMSVSILDEDTGNDRCGGVWVGVDRILTAEHCIDDVGKPSDPDVPEGLAQLFPELADALWNPTGQTAHFKTKTSGVIAAEIVKIDRDKDVALLVAKETVAHLVAQLATESSVHDGDPLDVVGSTVGLPFTYSRCTVASVRHGYDGTGSGNMVQVSGPIWSGNSGGGAYDSRGNLVGIADKMRSVHNNIVPDVSFFVPAWTLVSFIR